MRSFLAARAAVATLAGATFAVLAGAGSAAAATPTPVTIEVQTNLLTGPPGTFTTSGAGLCPSGTTTDQSPATGFQSGFRANFHDLKTFTCVTVLGHSQRTFKRTRYSAPARSLSPGTSCPVLGRMRTCTVRVTVPATCCRRCLTTTSPAPCSSADRSYRSDPRSHSERRHGAGAASSATPAVGDSPGRAVRSGATARLGFGFPGRAVTGYRCLGRRAFTDERPPSEVRFRTICAGWVRTRHGYSSTVRRAAPARYMAC
jgi:hypothetical protein